jgi:hypothetical protein
MRVTNRLSLGAALLMTVCLGLASQGAWAFTECSVAPTRVHSGDAGNFYIFFSNGGFAIIRENDLDYRATMSIVLFAIATDRTLTARYEANNVPCNSTYQELTGLSMSK